MVCSRALCDLTESLCQANHGRSLCSAAQDYAPELPTSPCVKNSGKWPWNQEEIKKYNPDVEEKLNVLKKMQ